MIDMEVSLVKSLGWSLRDIDETSMESLFPFVFRLTSEGKNEKSKTVFCDEVAWL